jgi:hypothetical protein
MEARKLAMIVVLRKIEGNAATTVKIRYGGLVMEAAWKF